MLPVEFAVHFVKCCYESFPHTTGLYCVPLFDATLNVCLLHISNSSIVFLSFCAWFPLEVYYQLHIYKPSDKGADWLRF